MSVLKIENFGGIRPSLSPRALPASAAQKNQNLFLPLNEFRPIQADSTLTTGLSNAKTLYRIDSTSAWVLSTSELSYVRGQVTSDTTKRTFYSNNTTPGVLRQFDKDGNDRQLGVPAPTSLTATATQGQTLNADELAIQLQEAIKASLLIAEPSVRYSGSTILAGPLNNPGLFFPNNTVDLPSQITSLNNWWALYAKVAISRINSLGINLDKIGVDYYDSSFAYIPIISLPYTYIQNGTPLSTSLPLIVNPRTGVRALTDAQVTALTDAVKAQFDPDTVVYLQRTELTTLVNDFYYLLFTAPAATAAIPDMGTDRDPTGPGPTIPTVPEYITSMSGYEMAPEWITYYEDAAAYALNKEIYNNNTTDAGTALVSISDRIAAIQRRATEITKEIEAVQMAAWRRVALDVAWVSDVVYGEAAAGGLDNLDAARVGETRFYLVTFVTDRGEESANSPPSAELVIDQYSTKIVNRPSVPSGRNITHWRIYRSVSTADLTTFQFVTELAISTTSFTDNVSNEALGEAIPSVLWAEPISGMIGLTGMPNGIMAAFLQNTIYFCEPYVPYAWPATYQVSIEFPIVGLGVFGQTLFVGTTGNPYLISGSDSASMSALKLESSQACVSRRSIVSVPIGVMYASPDGLCLVNGNGVTLVTEGIYTRQDWQALVPSSIFAIEHEGVYYAFYDTGATKGCLAFDTRSMKLGVIADLTTVTALYVDREADALFANDGSSIKRLFASGARTAMWKTPLVTLPEQASFSWLKVYGSQTAEAPVTVRWYGDGVLRHTATVTNTTPQRVPSGRYLEHEIEIESAARVTKVVMTSTSEELKLL